MFWITIIEHVAHHRGLRCDAGPSPRGGDPQVEHGLAAEKFTDARPQDLAAIGLSEIKHRGQCLSDKCDLSKDTHKQHSQPDGS